MLSLLLRLSLPLFLIFFVINSLPLKIPKAKLRPSALSIYYGGPGSGKTTFATYLCRWYLASGIPVYSNVPIKGAFILDKNDIGVWNIPYGLVLIDEAGLEYNNRDFKGSFSKASGGASALAWYKKHRHERCEVCLFSQGFEDMDKKLRELCSDMFIVRHSFIPGFIVRRRISKSPRLDKDTHQPIDFYDYVPFGSKRILARPLWKYFDSFDRMGLPDKVWLRYGEDSGSLIHPSSVSGSSPGLLSPSKETPEGLTEANNLWYSFMVSSSAAEPLSDA